MHLAINRKTRIVEYVDQLLAADACLNIPAANGTTALHSTADAGHIDIVEELLRLLLRLDTINSACADNIYDASRRFKQLLNPTPRNSSFSYVFIQ